MLGGRWEGPEGDVAIMEIAVVTVLFQQHQGEGAHMAARGVDGDAQVHKMADVLQVRFVEKCRHHHSGALLSCLGAGGRFRMDTLDISRAFLVLSWSFVLRTENFLG